MSYYQRHAERIKTRRRQRYHEYEKEACQKVVSCRVCDVGMNKCSMNKHLKTKKHATNLANRLNAPAQPPTQPPTPRPLPEHEQEIQNHLKRIRREKKLRKSTSNQYDPFTDLF